MHDLPKLLALAFVLAFLWTIFEQPVEETKADSSFHNSSSLAQTK